MSKYHVVFQFSGSYRIASNQSPDQHHSFFTKLDALLAGRLAQAQAGADPNLVFDLTNALPSELVDYLR